MIDEHIKASIIGITATVITYLFGGWDGLAQALTFFMIFNFMTGYLAAYKSKSRNPEKIFWGLAKMLVVLMTIIAAHRVDHIRPDPLDTDRFRMIVMGIACVYYAQSFFKNVKKLGFPVPKWLVDAIVDPIGQNASGRKDV